MKPTILAPILSEFSNLKFSDKRLKKRFVKIVEAAERLPAASLPKRSESTAALEGTYRFLDNPAVVPEEILDAHVQCTCARAAEHEKVLILHDTTTFRFGGNNEREGLGRVNGKSGHGFMAHYSICTSMNHEPLGTLGLYAWARQKKKIERKEQQALYKSSEEKESFRWIDAAINTGAMLADKTIPIHVMDREGDTLELFSFLLDSNQKFVIRMCHDRRINSGRKESRKLYKKLNEAKFFGTIDANISTKRDNKIASKSHGLTIRKQRKAKLEIKACKQEIFASVGTPSHFPQSITLNFVEVSEPRPPHGEEPVVWRLATTEPIDTLEQTVEIIDIYRKRWLIEEFFKGIKTGCTYERYQLADSAALMTMLAIESTIAWNMLRARWLTHYDPGADGSKILNKIQLGLLRENAKEHNRKLPKRPTAKQVLYEIAAVGGHQKNNGPPGWLTLRRGFDDLLSMEKGYYFAQRLRLVTDL